MFHWLLNHRLGATLEWLHKNPHVVETAYDRRMDEALAAISKKAHGFTRIACFDSAGRETGSFVVHTPSVLEHFDETRRESSHGRFIWELEVLYQWLYRHKPGIGTEDAPAEFSSRIAQCVPESEGKIKIYSSVCLACHREKPDFRVTFATSHDFYVAHSGAISCECGHVVFEHKSLLHFTVASKKPKNA